MSIWTFVLNLSDLNIHITSKKNYIEIMPKYHFASKILFYHLPTRGRAGIKLGDAWYVSNVSIIFIVPCYYLWSLGCLMGFIIHFYIIFGTNLLTQRPSPDCCFFCLFQGFAEKEYQTESKRNETFARDIFGGNHARESSGPSQGT